MTLEELQQRVKEFHEQNKFPVNTRIDTWPTGYEHKILQIGEEIALLSRKALSLAQALRNDEFFRVHLKLEELSEMLLRGFYPRDEVETFDGILDLSYILVGHCVVLDLPFAKGMAEVVRSNSTKIYGDVKGQGRRDKGPSYSPPNLKKVIDDFRNNR